MTTISRAATALPKSPNPFRTITLSFVPAETPESNQVKPGVYSRG